MKWIFSGTADMSWLTVFFFFLSSLCFCFTFVHLYRTSGSAVQWMVTFSPAWTSRVPFASHFISEREWIWDWFGLANTKNALGKACNSRLFSIIDWSAHYFNRLVHVFSQTFFSLGEQKLKLNVGPLAKSRHLVCCPERRVKKTQPNNNLASLI